MGERRNASRDGYEALGRKGAQTEGVFKAYNEGKRETFGTESHFEE